MDIDLENRGLQRILLEGTCECQGSRILKRVSENSRETLVFDIQLPPYGQSDS